MANGSKRSARRPGRVPRAAPANPVNNPTGLDAFGAPAGNAFGAANPLGAASPFGAGAKPTAFGAPVGGNVFGAKPFGAPFGAPNEPNYAAELGAFYRRVNPGKLDGDAGFVAKTLAKYRGRENVLFAKLEAKYGGAVRTTVPHEHKPQGNLNRSVVGLSGLSGLFHFWVAGRCVICGESAVRLRRVYRIPQVLTSTCWHHAIHVRLIQVQRVPARYHIKRHKMPHLPLAKMETAKQACCTPSLLCCRTKAKASR